MEPSGISGTRFQPGVIRIRHPSRLCRLGGFFEAKQYDRDAANHLHLFPVFPALGSRVRQGMRRQSQPLRVFVEFAPPADIAGAGEEKIYRPVEFVLPFPSVRDSPLLGVDQNNRSWSNHWVHRFVAPADDAALVRAGEVFLWRKKRGLIRHGIDGDAVWKP